MVVIQDTRAVEISYPLNRTLHRATYRGLVIGVISAELIPLTCRHTAFLREVAVARTLSVALLRLQELATLRAVCRQRTAVRCRRSGARLWAFPRCLRD